ncbi:FGGY family carbohydrate kinase [Amycolatopsis sp. RTGN1]|uniref:FGGY family carbohydrate kinase n=1 Tax=Amycolatopsis ponsaeliensis TaxID=2992142 RepID=UPI002550B6F3|nr:FGGY family carbohydrate kinase [Amycolatopsis sp. RTGN1]
MAANEVAICVDAGTTVIKTVVFDKDGRELAVTRRETTVRHPSRERCEQDMHEVWDAVVATVGEAVARVARPVRLLAVTAQGDGAWLVGPDGRPVGPAVLWNDGRATDVVRDWRADGTLERAYRINGSLTNAGLPNAILRSLQGDAPRTVLTCGGWLFLKLTGVLGIEKSEASAPWLDIHRGTYSTELTDLYGIDPAVLPPLLTEQVQPLTATELGLPAGTPVVLAPYDIVTTAFGAGATTVGQATCILGTTLCTEVLVAAPDTTGEPSGLTLDFGTAGLIMRSFPTLAGTGVVDWLIDLLGLADHDEVTTLAAQAPPGADGLRVWPYLSPAGERAPFLDPVASGFVGGVLFGHGRTHLARAVLEGLAHVIRDCLDAAPGRPVELGLCGGGAASPLWCRLIADITGVPAVSTEDSQVGAKGAQVFALTALGDYPDLAAAASALVRPAARYEPDTATRDLYEDAHAEFLQTRALAATRWDRWR